jgi:hypothetical protein
MTIVPRAQVSPAFAEGRSVMTRFSVAAALAMRECYEEELIPWKDAS